MAEDEEGGGELVTVLKIMPSDEWRYKNNMDENQSLWLVSLLALSAKGTRGCIKNACVSPETRRRRGRSPSLRQHGSEAREDLMEHTAEHQWHGDFLGANLETQVGKQAEW